MLVALPSRMRSTSAQASSPAAPATAVFRKTTDASEGIAEYTTT